MANYAVSASADDETIGDGASTTATVMLAHFNYGVTPATASYGSGRIDTSPIGTDTISAATFYWYHNAYTKTKANAYTRGVWVGGVSILSSSANPGAAGWHSQTLNSTAIAAINKSGYTAFSFTVDDLGSGTNNWQVRAWDYDGTGGSACYLAVTHAPAAGTARFSILR